MIIETLDTYHDEFLKKCQEFFQYSDKNNRWFDPNLSYSIVNNYHKYPYWTFLLTDQNEFIAMSCIQKHNFPEKTYRVLTRTFYDINFRRRHLAYEKNVKTPAMFMLENQLSWLENNCNIFISMETVNRIETLHKFSEKLNKSNLHGNWKVDRKYLYQTYQGAVNDKFQWQIISSRKKINLPKITINQWMKKYDQ